MFGHSSRKNKISLEDYNYEKDIQNRLIMADFEVFDIEVLGEILHSSLEIPLASLEENLDIGTNNLQTALDRISKTRLITVKNDRIFVDKEMRKYYESQIERFDDDFTPNLTFLKDLLKKVPIQVLPVWYSIPKMSDNIFHSIIEKYLQTPKTYQHYLDNIEFEDPLLNEIKEDLFNHPELRLTAQEIMETYDLDRVEFEQYMLTLEFHFIGFLSYQKIGGDWEEVITPLHEWYEYLKHIRDTSPEEVYESVTIRQLHEKDFGFIHDLDALLLAQEAHPLTYEMVKEILQQKKDPSYINLLFDTLEKLSLATWEEPCLIIHPLATKWLTQSIEEKSAMLYRALRPKGEAERDFYAVERCLKEIVNHGWLYFEDFLAGMTAPLGEEEPVQLKRLGRKWQYALPSYGKEESAFVQQIICECLFPAGVTTVGEHKGKLCFSITPHGQALLGG